MSAAYVGSSGDLLCKSCMVWMCSAGWILSSSPTRAGVLCYDLGGRLGNGEKKKKNKKNLKKKKTSFCFLSA